MIPTTNVNQTYASTRVAVRKYLFHNLSSTWILYSINSFQIDTCIFVLETNFEFVGKGWCRSEGCDVGNDKKCRVDGFFKDQVDLDDCRKACLQEPACTGFAYSNELHSKVPHRCFVHGSTSSTNKYSEWNTFAISQKLLPSKSSGHENSNCWRRKGIRSEI